MRWVLSNNILRVSLGRWPCHAAGGRADPEEQPRRHQLRDRGGTCSQELAHAVNECTTDQVWFASVAIDQMTYR